MLQLAGRGRYRVVPASVIAAGPAYQDAVTIDAGSSDGIKTGETVLNGAGFVGVVTSVSSHVSTVLLATDGSAQVGVRVAPGGEIGLVTGSGGSDSSQESAAPAGVRRDRGPAARGSRWSPSAGGRTRPAFPVGVITRVVAGVGTLTKIAYVRPYANDSSLGVVGVVVTPPRHNPLFSVLPPRPHPSPRARPASPHAQPSSGSRGLEG